MSVRRRQTITDCVDRSSKSESDRYLLPVRSERDHGHRDNLFFPPFRTAADPRSERSGRCEQHYKPRAAVTDLGKPAVMASSDVDGQGGWNHVTTTDAITLTGNQATDLKSTARHQPGHQAHPRHSRSGQCRRTGIDINWHERTLVPVTSSTCSCPVRKICFRQCIVNGATPLLPQHQKAPNLDGISVSAARSPSAHVEDRRWWVASTAQNAQFLIAST